MELNQYEASILRQLRRCESARFSALMRPTGLQSDSFKFHVRKLSKLHYIEKTATGEYRLTLTGKEFANNLDRENRRKQLKQAKLSVIVIGTRDSGSGMEYLVQCRQRQPFWGYWGFISGPVQWGESFESAAARELQKQTALHADFAIRTFYRKIDERVDEQSPVEDKLFVLVEANIVAGELATDWTGGQTQWMTAEKLLSQELVFADTNQLIDALRLNTPYIQNNNLLHGPY